MENVLITGITGRSGSWLFKKLVSEADKLSKYKFTFIVRSTEKANALSNTSLNQNIHIADIDDYDAMSKIFVDNNINTLLHIAGIHHSLKFVKNAVEHGIKRLILVHTTGIFSKYKSAGEEYRLIEKQISEMISGKDISLTILRPTMIYGTLDDQNICRFIKMVDKFKIFPVVKKGEFALQPVHHQDLGYAYYQVLVNPEVTKNKDYVLSGGTVINLIDILKLMSEYLGKKTHFVSVPFWFAYFGSLIVYALTFTKIDYRERVQRLVEPRAYSHEEAVKDFNYAPIAFKDGLKGEVDEYVKRK